MSDLPDVEATVDLLKAILSEPLDLVSEKRRFQGFLRDYAGRARVEQGLNLERRHLNVLVLGMRYRRFDGVVKGGGDAAGLVGLGDWLSRQEGYDKGLCQWVEVVWSKSLGLATGIDLDSKAHRRAEEEKRRHADKRARRRNGEKQARRREAEVKRQEEAARQRAKAARQAAGPGKVSPPIQSVEVFRDRLRSGGEGPAMVVLPTGRFRMGDLDGSGWSPERPVHTVTISRRIAMGQYPVTFEDYDLYVSAMGVERPVDKDRGFLKTLFGKKPERPKGPEQPDDKGWGRGRRPVISVNWHDAKAYAFWLSEQTGKRYRLPSESEWEYAARAGTETAYSWGDEIGVNRANCDGGGSQWDDKQTSPVGSFEPNAFGLYDMHGNVCEWVEDCWHDNYEGAPSDGRAWTSGGDSNRAVVRGGCCGSVPRGLRSAYRGWSPPSNRLNLDGFRLVQDLNP